MQESEPEVQFSSGEPEGARRLLFDLAGSVTTHVSALHAAGRDLIMRRTEAGAPVPKEIRFEIKIAPDEEHEVADSVLRQSVECWDHTYACGKSESGYIMCTAHVCMITYQ